MTEITSFYFNKQLNKIELINYWIEYLTIVIDCTLMSHD